MILRLNLNSWRLTLSLVKIINIMGVNSKLENGNHILMWDFDNMQIGDICEELHKIQNRYFLSDIHILETNKKEGNFIAYCFTEVTFQRAVEIISATQGIDFNHLRLGVFRGYFTLRTGEKQSGRPHIVARLEGLQLADVNPDEIKSWIEYETLSK